MDDTVVIGIGEYVVIEGATKISTVGLGSCIGTVIYDEIQKVSGMSHIMLPIRLNDLLDKGALRSRMKAKLAGGASLFDFKDDHLKIGDRNTEAVEQILSQQNIRIFGKDVGGDRGRTIIFDPITTKLHIKMVKKGPNEPDVKVI
jgi:chemotaxis protein CheD